MGGCFFQNRFKYQTRESFGCKKKPHFPERHFCDWRNSYLRNNFVSQHCAEYLDVVILPRSGGTRTYTTKWYDALVSYAWLLHGTLDFENFRIVPYGDSSGKKNDVFSSSSVYMVERDADSNDKNLMRICRIGYFSTPC